MEIGKKVDTVSSNTHHAPSRSPLSIRFRARFVDWQLSDCKVAVHRSHAKGLCRMIGIAQLMSRPSLV